MSAAVRSGPVALLIDADNLSAPEMVAQALQHLTHLAGPVAIRRAYGSAENLKGLAGVLRDGAFHLCVNLPLAKNTTDMALAVDAMDLCARFGPAVLAIGTGDADFAPLVLHLRERGVRTVCFAQANKMAPEVHGFYDEVVLLGQARRGVVASAAQVPVPASAPAPAPAPARKAAARKTPARKSAAKVQAAPPPTAAAADAQDDLAQRVQDLLRAMPGVAEGQAVDVGDVAKRLREAKLLSRSAVVSRFLKKHVPDLELTPATQPNKLRWPAAAA